jgi:hypothetical protein
MYEYNFETNQFNKNYSQILKSKFMNSLILDIRGEPERMLFFRNCPPYDVIVVPDDEGFIYIYRVTNESITFFDMIKENSGKNPQD